MSKKEAKTHQEPVKTIEEMTLNYQQDKYLAIPLAALWAKELRRKEENRHLTANELLELALRDVLSGSVDWKSIKKSMAESSSANGELLAAAAASAELKKSKD